MADLATLKALRARVAEATGPDRDLDADICVALQYVPGKAGAMNVRVYKLPDETPTGLKYGTADHETRWVSIPDLTASVDAALAPAERLLPAPFYERIQRISANKFECCIGFANRHIGTRAEASTRPLAILAATLDALIAQTEEAR